MILQNDGNIDGTFRSTLNTHKAGCEGFVNDFVTLLLKFNYWMLVLIFYFNLCALKFFLQLFIVFITQKALFLFTVSSLNFFDLFISLFSLD